MKTLNIEDGTIAISIEYQILSHNYEEGDNSNSSKGPEEARSKELFSFVSD